MRLGIYIYGLAAIATGIIDIAWGGFERAHQPIQAFGDNVPGSQIFAYVVAAVLVLGGAAVLARRTARFGAVALGIAYAIFAVFWLPRFYTAPKFLGMHAGVIIGVLGGMCTELIVIAAASLIYVHASTADFSLRRALSAARWIFGLSAVAFGLAHLTGISSNAAMVPTWLPPGQNFWVVLTGIAFVLAGIAIVIEVLDVLAARLLSLMLLIFSALALAPAAFAYPHNQITWGSNAYNLVAVASVWIFACCLAASREPAATGKRAPSPA